MTWVASAIAGPAIGHFQRNGCFSLEKPREIGLLQNRLAHWRPKPWGQHLGARAQPGGMSSRPRGPLPSNARGEKTLTQNGRFSAASGKQFRSLADRWRSSATGHAGPASCKVAAGAYQFCAATLCRVWSCRLEKSTLSTICPASSKNGPRDPRSNHGLTSTQKHLLFRFCKT